MSSKVLISALTLFSAQFFLGCDNDKTKNGSLRSNANGTPQSSAPAVYTTASGMKIINILAAPDSVKINHGIDSAQKIALRLETMKDVVPLVDIKRADRDFDALAKEWETLKSKPMPSDNFSQTLKDDLKALVLYADPDSPLPGISTPGAQRKFDVLMIKTTCDYDKDWQKLSQDQITNNVPFWIIHTNAVDISQSDDEFNEYSQPISGGRQLDQAKYLADMNHIARNALLAAVETGVDNVVWFPFGMGAFIVKLPERDSDFNDEDKMKALKLEVVKKMREAYDEVKKSNPNLKLFICLPIADAHSKVNRDSFVEVFANVNDVTIYEDTDAFLLGQHMANDKKQVAVLNGGNKFMVGNHWFDDIAPNAIDENMVRRSHRMGAVAFVLNHGKLWHNVRPLNLEDAVKHYVGNSAFRRFSDL